MATAVAYTTFYPLNAGQTGFFDPWIGGWNVEQGDTYLLDGQQIGHASRLNTRAETSATSPFDVGVFRGKSYPLAPQTISGTVDMVIGVSESNLAADMYTRLYIAVYNVTDALVHGVALSYAESSGTGTEWTTTNTGKALASPQTLSAVTVPNDGKEYVLIIEAGARAFNAVTTSRTAQLRFGAVDTDLVAMPALAAGGTNTTTRAGFFVFSNAITVLHPTPPLFTAGQMVVPAADPGEAAVILTVATGAIVGYWLALPSAETGDILPSGIFAITAQVTPGNDVAAVQVYGADSQLVVSIPVSTLTPGVPWNAFSPLRGDAQTTFYVQCVPDAGGHDDTLHAISAAGVVLDSWILPASANGGATAMAPARDGSKVYFGFGDGTIIHADGVGRYDLVADSELAPLIPIAAGLLIGRDLLVTLAGDVIVPVLPAVGDWELRRYSDGGTLLATYALPAGSATGDEIELQFDPGDDTTFWARLYPSSTTSTWRQIRISDGTVLTDYTVPLVDGSSNPLIGLSCPFLIAPSVPVPPECPGDLGSPRTDGLPYMPWGPF